MLANQQEAEAPTKLILALCMILRSTCRSTIISSIRKQADIEVDFAWESTIKFYFISSFEYFYNLYITTNRILPSGL